MPLFCLAAPMRHKTGDMAFGQKIREPKREGVVEVSVFFGGFQFVGFGAAFGKVLRSNQIACWLAFVVVFIENQLKFAHQSHKIKGFRFVAA